MRLYQTVLCFRWLQRLYLIVFGAISVSISGCMVGPDFERPTAKLKTQFDQTEKTEFTELIQTTLAESPNPASWWGAFNDPTLTDLLARAARENLSLQRAALRIYQARSQLGVADASLLPTVGLGGSVARTDQPNALTQYLNASSQSNPKSLVVQANWEIDFWGKYRRGIESTVASLASTTAAYYAADVSLAADVANTYISIRNYQSLLRVAKTNLALQAESLRIASSRFKNGATSLLDLSQAQSQYEQTKSEIPTLLAGLKNAQFAMSILLGESPDFYEKNYGQTTTSLRVPQTLQVGIPKDLLRRRPDVLQAEYAAAAQSALIGVNTAALYPSFSLSGYFGFQSVGINSSNQSSSLFSWDNRSSSIGGSLLFPLFYRGAIVDQIRVQDSVFQQSILNYQNLVLQAQKEVEQALVSISTSLSSVEDLKRSAAAAQRAAVLALDRYKAGQNDYNTVIVAQQQLLLVQNSLVQTQTNNLLGYVAAFKALGGGWSGELSIPALPTPMISQMQARTNWGDALANPAELRLVKSTETIQ
jgi:NodT family efflux transporter outer membrane factor (OMF) lipoprotein